VNLYWRLEVLGVEVLDVLEELVFAPGILDNVDECLEVLLLFYFIAKNYPLPF